VAVPTFTIRVVNESFASSQEQEFSSAEGAMKQAVKAALQIGSDEIASGKPFFAAEVKVCRGSDVVGRSVVSIGASPLQTTD
jgi:hypothetical protein